MKVGENMHSAHPSLPEFEYIKPQTSQEACEFLANHPGESRPFMGGTDCLVRMRDGFLKDKYLVDVKGLDGNNAIAFDPILGLTIGAAVPMNKVISNIHVLQHYPLLAEAAKSVASYQLRNRATIVGNICNASPAGDTIGSCILYKGILNVVSPSGRRIISLDGFFQGPGKTTLKPGDLVLSISFPIPAKVHYGRYLKLGRNAEGDLSITGVTILASQDASKPSGFHFQVVLASVAPIPLVSVKAGEVLNNHLLTDQTIDEAAQAAMDSATPIDDVRGSAIYRKHMVRNLTKRALVDIKAIIK
jgi:carbon-monoxide dehydrogenase medium subunit